MKLSRILQSSLIALSLCATMPVAASSLQVSPTGLDLTAAQNADSLTLSNAGDAPLRAQVQVFRWTQKDGKDILEPTREVVATPAMLSIAPGTKQLVRVVRLAPPAAQESSYRIIVSELPGATGKPMKAGLTFLLKYSLPVFIAPQVATGTPTSVKPVLSAQLRGNELEVRNSGRQHARLSQLVWIDAAGRRRELAPGLLGYVLAGQTMQWPVPTASVSGAGRFEALINDDHVATPLPASPAP